MLIFPRNHFPGSIGSLFITTSVDCIQKASSIDLTTNIFEPKERSDEERSESPTTAERSIMRDIPQVQTASEFSEEVHEFISKGCGCKRNCTGLFPEDFISSSRLQCQELDSYCSEHVNHHHLLIFGAMNTLVRNQPSTIGKKKKTKDRKETFTHYHFRGQEVCQSFFQFVFACGPKRLKNLKRQFKEEGMAPKVHKNAGLTSHLKSIPFDDCQNAVNFIHNYSEVNALVLPGRIPTKRRTDLILLPTNMTKIYIHTLYEDSCISSDKVPVTLSSWYKIWQTFCSNISIQKPKTDLCTICQQNQSAIGKLATMDEDEKELLFQRSSDHLKHVKVERAAYKDSIEKCLAVGTESGTVVVPTYDWQKKLQAGMSNIPNLTQMHHFEIRTDTPGIVHTKKLINSEVEVSYSIINNDFPSEFGKPPEIIKPSGLTLERQLYLFEKIRPFVPIENQDTLCPAPSSTTRSATPLPNPSGLKSTLATPPPTSSGLKSTPIKETKVNKRKQSTPRKFSPKRRSRPTCGYCKELGHRDQTSNVKGMEENGRIGFAISTSKAVAMQSLAVSNSPSDSSTLPKLYLENNIHHITIKILYVEESHILTHTELQKWQQLFAPMTDKFQPKVARSAIEGAKHVVDPVEV
ncbi:hypothetical protein C0J52_21414 [Blattella germanica]|nr:hypothetical protein C0J52_21414 [Blattella germanica]